MRRRLNCLFVAVMLVGAPALAQSDTGEVPSGGSRDGKRSTTTLSASGESATRLDHSDHASSSGKSSRFTLDLSVASGAQPLAAARTSSDGDERVEASTRASQGK